jgi:CRISPR-associated protein Csd1
MGWMQHLVETYENVKDTNAFEEADHPLVPAGFVEKKAAIHVILTKDGTFWRAERVPKEENRFVIPSTPEAECRVGQPAPYPLCDELRYVAGDFPTGKNPYFDAYIAALGVWCARNDAPPPLRVLRDYLDQRRLVADMRASGFAFDTDKDMKSFVVFTVQEAGTGDKGLWEREDVRESWLGITRARAGKRILCYVEGEVLPDIDKHPKFLGNAKLISSQCDKTIFQYRGRFTQASEAVNVSYDASIKAHNTLGWLLKRQGFTRYYGMNVVAWATNGCQLTSPADENALTLIGGDEYPSTFEAYGKALRDAAAGLSGRIAEHKPEATNDVVIVSMEAATPGRVSLTYYQEMPGGVYAERLRSWYESCAWEMRRTFGEGKESKSVQYIWTPTPDDIAIAVLGQRTVKDARADRFAEKSPAKLVRQLRMRLLKCTVEATPLPRDIVLAAFRRASAPQGFTDQNGRWQESAWRKTLAVACALVRKEQAIQKKEGTDVTLDETNRDRSYLYGRLLALADMAEYSAMDKNAYRQTNAIRYMQMFQQRPFDTWVKLHGLLLPYYGKLGAYSERYKKLIGQVEMLFDEADRASREPLKGTFLHGYYCQRQSLFTKKEKSEGEKDNDGTEE